MNFKNNYFKIIFLAILSTFSSCETLELDQLEDPSALSAKFLDPVYTFNYVQLQLPDFVDSANGFTQRVTRQMAMTGGNTYDNAFQPISFNNNWSTAYIMLNAIKAMEPKALAEKQFYTLGAAKVIRCYVLATLVDIYGDIPYSEALQGDKNLFPKYDKSADVYKGILSELEEAKELLSRANNKNGSGFTDLYYTSEKGWIKLANTLRLKMLCTARLAGNDIGVPNIGPAINQIVAEGNYIKTADEDFAFRYGSNRNAPNSRHPLYNDQYELGGGSYIANYMMWTMTEEKRDPSIVADDRIIDPRTAFYFYRPDASPIGEDSFTLPLGVRPSHYNDAEYNSFYIGSVRTPYKVSSWFTLTNSIDSNVPTSSLGYWGRDHGDNSGIPPDNEKRTVAGLYPIGGKYGNDFLSVQKSGTDGAKGAGIMPIILSSYVHFMLAEAILTAGVSGDAKVELLRGIDQSIDKSIRKIGDYPNIDDVKINELTLDPRTNTFYPQGTYPVGTIVIEIVAGVEKTNGTVINSYTDFNKINIQSRREYKAFIEKIYDGSNNTKKLELILKEYFIASWGNGIEPYNNYRRTGYPSNLQPTLEVVSGDYFYTALYPTSAANNNPKTPTNVRIRKVFWDRANLILR